MLRTFLIVKHTENWVLVPGNFSWCCLIFASRHITFVIVNFVGFFQTMAIFLSTSKVILNLNSQFVFTYRPRFGPDFFFFNLNCRLDTVWIVLWEPFPVKSTIFPALVCFFFFFSSPCVFFGEGVGFFKVTFSTSNSSWCRLNQYQASLLSYVYVWLNVYYF